MKNYKELLISYISSVDAATGSIVYQPFDCLIEVCKSQETKEELLQLVERSEIRLLDSNVSQEGYQELIDWSKNDLLLESSENVLFCIPKAVA